MRASKSDARIGCCRTVCICQTCLMSWLLQLMDSPGVISLNVYEKSTVSDLAFLVLITDRSIVLQQCILISLSYKQCIASTMSICVGYQYGSLHSSDHRTPISLEDLCSLSTGHCIPLLFGSISQLIGIMMGPFFEVSAMKMLSTTVQVTNTTESIRSMAYKCSGLSTSRQVKNAHSNCIAN